MTTPPPPQGPFARLLAVRGDWNRWKLHTPDDRVVDGLGPIDVVGWHWLQRCEPATGDTSFQFCEACGNMSGDLKTFLDPAACVTGVEVLLAQRGREHDPWLLSLPSAPAAATRFARLLKTAQERRLLKEALSCHVSIDVRTGACDFVMPGDCENQMFLIHARQTLLANGAITQEAARRWFPFEELLSSRT